MRIRVDEEVGTLEIDGVLLSANVLRELVDPDRRLLFRFQRRGGVIEAIPLDESKVIWIDPPDEKKEHAIEFGTVEREIKEGGRQ
jgi:hypothetical protein